MDASTYYNNLTEARKEVISSINKIEAEEVYEYSTVNYPKILNGLYQFKAIIEKMQNIHKYLKMSKEDFVNSITVENLNLIEQDYVIKDYESAEIIAYKFGQQLSEILTRNNITTSEMTAGTTIKVKTTKAKINDANKSIDDVPTFGSHKGDLIFGTDISNNVELGDDGDLKTLTPKETVIQGIKNRVLTQSGDYPLVPEFGIKKIVGNEFPPDLIEALVVLNIRTQLLLDPRISSVDNIKPIQTGNKIVFQVKLTLIDRSQLEV